MEYSSDIHMSRYSLDEQAFKNRISIGARQREPLRVGDVLKRSPRKDSQHALAIDQARVCIVERFSGLAIGTATCDRRMFLQEILPRLPQMAAGDTTARLTPDTNVLETTAAGGE